VQASRRVCFVLIRSKTQPECEESDTARLGEYRSFRILKETDAPHQGPKPRGADWGYERYWNGVTCLWFVGNRPLMHPIAPQTSHTIPIPLAIPNLHLKGAGILSRASRANKRRPWGGESCVPHGDGAQRDEARQHDGYGGPALGTDIGRAAKRMIVSFQIRGAPRPAPLYDLLCGPARDPVGV
jgi:hypothetical protein